MRRRTASRFDAIPEPAQGRASQGGQPVGRKDWSREILAGIVQLIVVGLVLVVAAVWNAGRAPLRPGSKTPSAPLPNASSAINTKEEGTWLEGGAFRTLKAIGRRLDFRPKQRSNTETSKNAVQDFKGRIDDFEVPAPSPRWVKKAIERRQGNFLHRDLRFASSEDLQSLIEEYTRHYETQGYEVQASAMGELGNGEAHVMGNRGRDRVRIKLTPGREGQSVQVAMYERVESFERRR